MVKNWCVYHNFNFSKLRKKSTCFCRKIKIKKLALSNVKYSRVLEKCSTTPEVLSKRNYIKFDRPNPPVDQDSKTLVTSTNVFFIHENVPSAPIDLSCQNCMKFKQSNATKNLQSLLESP